MYIFLTVCSPEDSCSPHKVHVQEVCSFFEDEGPKDLKPQVMRMEACFQYHVLL